MPRTTSPRLRFGRISRDAVEEQLDQRQGAPGDGCEQHAPVRNGKAGPREQRKSLRATSGNQSSEAGLGPGPLAGRLTLPRAVFIIDCLAPCFHLPSFTQSKPGGQTGPPWVLPVPSRACRRAGLGQSPSFLGLAAPHTPRAERPPCTAALPPGRSAQPCSLTS